MMRGMERLQEELASLEFSAEVGGGILKATVSGNLKVKSVEIAQEAFEEGDPELLADMVVAAVNAALEGASLEGASRLNSVTGGMTGGMSLPGSPA